MSPEKALVTMTEAARFLGIGKTKLAELVRSGELTVVRIGTAIRIPTEALQAWIEREADVWRRGAGAAQRPDPRA